MRIFTNIPKFLLNIVMPQQLNKNKKTLSTAYHLHLPAVRNMISLIFDFFLLFTAISYYFHLSRTFQLYRDFTFEQ